MLLLGNNVELDERWRIAHADQASVTMKCVPLENEAFGWLWIIYLPLVSAPIANEFRHVVTVLRVTVTTGTKSMRRLRLAFPAVLLALGRLLSDI